MATCTTIQDIYYVEDNTLPELVCTLKDTDGVVVDITGYSFELHIGYGVPKNIVGVLVDAANGIFKFAFVVGDIQKGKHLAEIMYTTVESKTLTFQSLRFNVAPKIVV